MTDLSLEEFIECLQGLRDGGNKVAGLVHGVLTAECDESLEGVSSLVVTACDQATKLAQDMVNRRDNAFDRIPDLESYAAVTANDNRNRVPAHSSLLQQAGVVAQLWPGTVGGIPNSPGLLSSAVALGLLGGGAGYAIGRAKDYANDEDNPRRRRLLTALGVGVGVTPSILRAVYRMRDGQSLQWVPPQDKTAVAFSYQGQNMVVPSKITGIAWNDPYVSQHLPPEVRVGITVAMEGAKRVNNPYKPTFAVTPSDLGVVAMGAGGGYLGGLVAGKMLGALFNVSPQTQQALRRNGAFAGVIRKAVPLIFGN